MNGKAVQLVGGNENEKKCEVQNPVELAREFDKYGEIAVIDLDAALGKGDNRDIIRQICQFAQCRVGGGIRSAAQAKELVSFGAYKIIVGSKAFENNRVNTEFLTQLAQAVGKERIMVAVDSLNGEIVTHGWKNRTGLRLFETVPQLDPFVHGILFTAVEREGRIQGPDMDSIFKLRDVFSKSITAAGGIQSIDEIRTLAEMGIDAQIGMALYTGKIALDDAFIASLKWPHPERNFLTVPFFPPLIPIIATDSSHQVLMHAYTDRNALKKTFETGCMWYFSRSRQKLWQKGETSGHTQKLIKFRVDCDRDTLLAAVEQTGPACHLDSYSCFGDKTFDLRHLYKVIQNRFENPTPGSYTATLDNRKVREKLTEEAQEVIEAKEHHEIVWEAADVLYFLTVLLQKEGVTIDEVFMELQRRTFTK